MLVTVNKLQKYQTLIKKWKCDIIGWCYCIFWEELLHL